MDKTISSFLDPKLQEYATPRQWELLKALQMYGSERKAADALGVHKSSFYAAKLAVQQKAAKNGYAPEFDWFKPVPAGYVATGASTLYDLQTGEAKIQWVKSKLDNEAHKEAIQAILDGFKDDLPRYKPTKQLKVQYDEQLMVCYPVGDHHIGMLSDDSETGKNYNLDIAEEIISGSIDHLVKTAPNSQKATLIFLGDFLHFDNMTPVTQTGNNLDASGRYPQVVKYAIRCMRYLVDSALKKHEKVHVIIEIGNHDLSSSIFLQQCLANVYEKEERITVDTSPSHYHYFKHGQNLVGVHHGHGAKMNQLPLIMAADKPDLWGSSKYRYWYTGHVHHDQVKDFHGTKVESFRILAPSDAWAHNKGYRAMQDMKCIVLHSEYGEVGRHTVNPEMLK